MNKYNEQFRRVVSHSAPRHNCFAEIPKEKKAKVNNSRYMINMELRAKSEPKEFVEKENSAHQFSVRNASM